MGKKPLSDQVDSIQDILNGTISKKKEAEFIYEYGQYRNKSMRYVFNENPLYLNDRFLDGAMKPKELAAYRSYING